MSADLVDLVTDQKLKSRIIMGFARHLDWEAETIQAMEHEDALFTDGEGRFMLVPSFEEELHIHIPLSDPALRIVHHPGLGRVAELWHLGFQEGVMLLEPEAA